VAVSPEDPMWPPVTLESRDEAMMVIKAGDC
jgi:hypothetical protein